MLPAAELNRNNPRILRGPKQQLATLIARCEYFIIRIFIS